MLSRNFYTTKTVVEDLDLEYPDYDDIYKISEKQGVRHQKLDRLVEPGDMDSLGKKSRCSIKQAWEREKDFYR